jgi:hypothetical protein
MVVLPPNQPPQASEGQLVIDRLACHINLPGGIEDAASIAGRLERMARSDVAQVCAEHLDWPDEGTVYRLRHLHLSLWLDKSSISTGKLSRRWGALLATAIMKSIRSGSARDLVRFPSPRHFVTAFLRDIVDGSGWGKWYYEEFNYLRRLPVGSVATQLLATHPAWIHPAMEELERTGHASRLLARMTANDLYRLWAALELPLEPTPDLLLGTRIIEQSTLPRLMSLWPSVPLSYGFDRRSRARDRFVMLLAANRVSIAESRGPELASIIHAVVDLIALSRTAPDLAMVMMMRSPLYPQAVQRIASSPVGDALGWLTPMSRTQDGRTMLSALAEAASNIVRPRVLTNGDRSVLDPAARDDPFPGGTDSAEIITSDSDDDRDHSTQPLDQSGRDSFLPASDWNETGTAQPRPERILPALTSQVGSIFLLTPALIETRLWDHWLAERGEETARAFIYVLALKALGRSRALLYQSDPTIAAFAGLDRPPGVESRVAVADDGYPGAWPDELPKIASRWYPESERDLTMGIAEGLRVLRDNRASYWLAAWPSENERLFDMSSLNYTDPSGQRRMARRMSDDEQTEFEAEVNHLQLGRHIGYPWLTPSLDAALSIAASLVLRRTAVRLPRMDQSSPSYLATQFLAQPATLRFHAAFDTVELSGGPLGIVLRLAALPEWIRAPWLPRPLSLNLAGDSGGS